MIFILEAVKAFIKITKSNLLTLIGAILSTIFGPILLFATISDILSPSQNPYTGVIIYLILPIFFICGLLLFALGLYLWHRSSPERLSLIDRLHKILEDQIAIKTVFGGLIIVGILTFINIFIIVVIAYNGYHYMDSVKFCGQVCHSVMMPEYTAYINSPHSRVKCVECHIGPGASWFVKSKLSGLRQVIAVHLDTYHKPLLTPVENLRPARETCEQCHRPELFHGDKLSIKTHFLEDKENTKVQTILLLKIGSGGFYTERPHGIHWHTARESRIIYYHADRERLIIPFLEILDHNGNKTIYYNQEIKNIDKSNLKIREMDCMDCHNRPTHIFRSPDEALDLKFLSGQIPKSIPYIKKISLEAITRSYQNRNEALINIAQEIWNYYKSHQTEWLYSQKENHQLLNRAIKAVLEAYSENVWQQMNISWNTYLDHLGHKNDKGCFRCHNDLMQTDDGKTISQDCNSCHIILAEKETNPQILKLLSIGEQ